MAVLTQALMVQTAIDVNGMEPPQKVRLADEIFAQQPNLLASILALPRMGVGLLELEVPLVLALSWVVAGRVLARWPLRDKRPALALLAFALLMVLELATALAFGQSPAQFLTAMTTPAGALGLAGQIGFALIPLVRQARG